MALRVPERHVGPIKKFLKLPDEKIKEFLEALASAGPKFNVYDLASDVSEHLELPRDVSEGVLLVLASLYITKDRQDAPVEAFVDQEVAVALRKALSEKEIKEQWPKFRSFLIAALSLESTVGTASKAGHILTEHERLFVDARIVTDIRPIFHADVSERPDAAVIVHMLRISCRDNFGNRTAQYFALDTNDLRMLRDLIDRSIKKEETLHDLMKDPGISILTPKQFF